MGRPEGRIVASAACDGNGERGRMDLRLGASCAFERAALNLCLRSFLGIAVSVAKDRPDKVKRSRTAQRGRGRGQMRTSGRKGRGSLETRGKDGGHYKQGGLRQAKLAVTGTHWQTVGRETHRPRAN